MRPPRGIPKVRIGPPRGGGGVRDPFQGPNRGPELIIRVWDFEGFGSESGAECGPCAVRTDLILIIQPDTINLHMVANEFA